MHECLDGQGDGAPIEWLVSRVCQEFKCLPSAAVKELMENDLMVFDIIEFRAYAAVKEQIDNAKTDKEMPNHPMVDKVFEVQAELLRRRRADS